jgi:hypothetical protein
MEKLTGHAARGSGQAVERAEVGHDPVHGTRAEALAARVDSNH